MVDASGNNHGNGSHPKAQEDDPIPEPKEKKPCKDKKKKDKKREGATTEDEGSSIDQLPPVQVVADSIRRPDTPCPYCELEAATIAVELVDRAKNSVTVGAEVSRKRSQSEAEGAFAEITQEVSNLQQQIHIINPGAVQAILRDLSPLSDTIVTVLHLAREYQEALLPLVTGTSDTCRVLEAISMLEARI
ncbi:hypothetical protein VKT23_017221 [Stygiomarasmius scandens]|uniref:Uncharacterized protein n=1 Tax=Marasmiellus scandens TaxID=2682957 RepID=A0ABR1IT86_9AGAR